MCVKTTESRDAFTGVVIHRTEAELKEAMKIILPVDRVGIDDVLNRVLKEGINGNYYPFNTGRFYTVVKSDINELNRVVNAYIVFGYAPYGVVQYLNNMWAQTITLKEDVRITTIPQAAWSYEQEKDAEIRVPFTPEHENMYKWILACEYRKDNKQLFSLVCDIIDKIDNTNWNTMDVLNASYTILQYQFDQLIHSLYGEVKHRGVERDIVGFHANVPLTTENLTIWVDRRVDKKKHYTSKELSLEEFVSLINEIIRSEEE
ncbi:MAG: hypothetical protein IKA36_04105 [Clostridia bacterium]|nr:hypothetical protein [Clostridia bacterium]